MLNTCDILWANGLAETLNNVRNAEMKKEIMQAQRKRLLNPGDIVLAQDSAWLSSRPVFLPHIYNFLFWHIFLCFSLFGRFEDSCLYFPPSPNHPCPTHPKWLGKEEGTVRKRRTNWTKELFTWFCRSFCDYDFESWKRKEKTDWWWINLVLANLSGLELPVRLVWEDEPEHGGAEGGVDLLHPGLQLAVGRGRGRGGWRGAWAWAPPTKPPHF